MTARAKRRRRQKYRVLKAQEYLNGLHPLQFSALLTALDDLEDFDPGDALVKWPRKPTLLEKLRGFILGTRDAKNN